MNAFTDASLWKDLSQAAYGSVNGIPGFTSVLW